MPIRFPSVPDRVAALERPEGVPLLHQTWDRVLFLHWQVPVAKLERYLPERLAVDTYEHRAFVGITAFRVSDVRPSIVPPLPWPTEFLEVNVRTYVHLDGVPGVWFLSLDADDPLTVEAARALFHLPYLHAEMESDDRHGQNEFVARREEERPRAGFKATWSVGNLLPEVPPDSLEFFLTERYTLFTADAGTLYECRIHHEPWALREATLTNFRTTLLQADGLTKPTDNPMVLAANPVSVEIWPLREV